MINELSSFFFYSSDDESYVGLISLKQRMRLGFNLEILGKPFASDSLHIGPFR